MKKTPIEPEKVEITFTTKGLADYIHCSRWTVYKHMKDGKLPRIVIGRKVIFLKSDIDRLFKIEGGNTGNVLNKERN